MEDVGVRDATPLNVTPEDKVGEREVEGEPLWHPDTEGDFEGEAHAEGTTVPVFAKGVVLTVLEEVIEGVDVGDKERREVGDSEVEVDREGEREGVEERVRAGVTLRKGDKDAVVERVVAVDGVGVDEKQGEVEETIVGVRDTVPERVPPTKLAVSTLDGVGERVLKWVEVRWAEEERVAVEEMEVEGEGEYQRESVPPGEADSVKVS